MRVHPEAVIEVVGALVTLIGIGAGVLWGITYVLVIRQAFRDKTYGMPFAAMCANVIWEFLYTFIFLPSETGWEFWVALIVNFIWFALDVVIVITWLRYWDTDYPPGFPPRSHIPLLVLGLLTATALLVGIQLQFGGNPPGGISSFVQNLMMSLLFIDMLGRRNSSKGQSLWIALSKLLGSACASIFFFMTGFTSFYWVALFLSIFFYDSLYTVMLYRKIQAERRAALQTA